MADNDEHTRSIIDQFTKQAIPFARKQELSREETMRLLLDIAGVGPADTVLDVACGPGLVACAFAARAKEVTGIDITPAMLEQARQLQARKGLGNLFWRLGPALPLPFADGSFSMVITRYSLHHFIDPAAVFREMTRVCTPGGAVMVADAAPSVEKRDAYDRVEKLKDPSHTSALTPDELLALAQENGLTEVRTAFYTVDMELESQLAASFPDPGDDEKIRRMFREDVGKDELGMGARMEGDALYFSYPIMVLVGKKPL